MACTNCHFEFHAHTSNCPCPPPTALSNMSSSQLQRNIANFLRAHKWVIMNPYSYTPRTLRTCCSQSELKIFKIHERNVRALLLYNFTPNTLRTRVQHRVRSCSRKIGLYASPVICILFVKFNNVLKLSKMSYLSHIKTKKFVCVVYELD